jgi:phosphohistidine phosphatase
MRELQLFRHAKSRRDRPEAEDHERDLAPRGERSARRMGELAQEKGAVPTLVLCSTARRAVHTIELAAEAWTSRPPIRFLKALYLADPSRLLAVVRQQPADVERLMLVGHNPGLQRLAVALVQDIEGTGSGRSLAEKFPTGALARIALDRDDWSGAEASSGRLLAFWRPRDLEG